MGKETHGRRLREKLRVNTAPENDPYSEGKERNGTPAWSRSRTGEPERRVETVTPMVDPDGVWRVSGYHIR